MRRWMRIMVLERVESFRMEWFSVGKCWFSGIRAFCLAPGCPDMSKIENFRFQVSGFRCQLKMKNVLEVQCFPQGRKSFACRVLIMTTGISWWLSSFPKLFVAFPVLFRSILFHTDQQPTAKLKIVTVAQPFNNMQFGESNKPLLSLFSHTGWWG